MRGIRSAFALLLPLLLGVPGGARGAELEGELAGFKFLEVTTAGAALEDTLPMIVGLHYMTGSPETSRPQRLSIPAEDAPPVFVFHGREDAVVPLAGAREAAAFIESLGISVELHEYPETGHAYPESMRSDYQRIVRDLLSR